MIKRGNHNIFVGDRGYQMTFWLTFKGQRQETKYEESFSQYTNHYQLIILSIQAIILLWAYFNTTCYNFGSSCKLPWAWLLSLALLLIAILLVYQKYTNSFLIRALAIPSLGYLFLVQVHIIGYSESIFFSVISSHLLSK